MSREHDSHIPAVERMMVHEGCGQTWPNPMQRWGRGERADVLGLFERPFTSQWESHWSPEPIEVYAGDLMLSEIKVQRPDKKRDDEKPWRATDVLALATFRVIACPEGLIEPHEIPDESLWGLYWLTEDESFQCVKAPQRCRNVDTQGEKALLGRLLRQASGGMVQGTAASTRQRKKPTPQHTQEVRAWVEQYGRAPMWLLLKAVANGDKAKAKRIKSDLHAGVVEGVRMDRDEVVPEQQEQEA